MRDNYAYKNMLQDLGLKISYYRKKRGLTQEELAERIGVSTSCIGVLEAPNVSRSSSLKTIYAIAEELEVPMSKLFEQEA